MIILVRHGQTAANANGLLLGRDDPPLTELGRRQAEALAVAVGGADLVISSPLLRARQTAAAIAGEKVSIDERWIEMDYGEYDGWPVGDVPAAVWEKWRSDADFVPPGGESLADCGRRVRSACQDLVEQAGSADVVVVSHVSPIKAAVAWCLGVGDEVAWRMFLDVAAVCRVGIGPRGATLRSYNERSHLAAAGL